VKVKEEEEGSIASDNQVFQKYTFLCVKPIRENYSF
jgi:hypothetical protein